MTQHWRDSAACHGQQALFFPVRGEAGDERRTRLAAAKELCAGCGVREDCLAFAVSKQAPFGIWGGTDFGQSRPRQEAAERVAASGATA